MNKTLPRKRATKQKRSKLDKVKNPQGRLDVAAFRTVERLCERHPVAKVAFEEFRGIVGDALGELLGPVNRHAKSGLKILKAHLENQTGGACS